MIALLRQRPPSRRRRCAAHGSAAAAARVKRPPGRPPARRRLREAAGRDNGFGLVADMGWSYWLTAPVAFQLAGLLLHLHPGVYEIGQVMPGGAITPLYLGQTKDLRGRFGYYSRLLVTGSAKPRTGTEAELARRRGAGAGFCVRHLECADPAAIEGWLLKRYDYALNKALNGQRRANDVPCPCRGAPPAAALAAAAGGGQRGRRRARTAAGRGPAEVRRPM
ncbi:hypothetical protein Rsub_07298 [Raphidocelis subcapitata]|uniref:GIY-YIG domain-containing protein n=1 Tax=Raphidocelis subcapitata TaxID=307507 RepID=A0A2V0P844_9CHLO|nr:hypothetical protein Rsub_07298 [Raphidocelis subcapitata]|eukprot:GBF94030.1 hypothetical protein Rsub_07298 [Raphidocelis subcapitata]